YVFQANPKSPLYQKYSVRPERPRTRVFHQPSAAALSSRLAAIASETSGLDMRMQRGGQGFARQAAVAASRRRDARPTAHRELFSPFHPRTSEHSCRQGRFTLPGRMALRAKTVSDEAEDDERGHSKSRTTTKAEALFAGTRRDGAANQAAAADAARGCSRRGAGRIAPACVSINQRRWIISNGAAQ